MRFITSSLAIAAAIGFGYWLHPTQPERYIYALPNPVSADQPCIMKRAQNTSEVSGCDFTQPLWVDSNGATSIHDNYFHRE